MSGMGDSGERRSELYDLWLIGLLSLAMGAFFVGALTRATREEPQRVAGALRLAGTTVDVDVERATGHLTLRNRDGSPLLEADLGLWVDGEIRQLALKATQIDLVDKRTVEAHFPLLLPSGRTHAVLRLSLQTGASDLLVASLAVSGRTGGEGGPTVRPHAGLLRFGQAALRLRRRGDRRSRHRCRDRADLRARRASARPGVVTRWPVGRRRGGDRSRAARAGGATVRAT